MDMELLRRLAKLDSSAVSDALDRLQLRGVAMSLTALSAPKRIVGVAVTVKLGPAGVRSTSRHLCTAAVDASGPGCIVVIDHAGRTDVAGWGGILSLGAVVRRIEGVVIDGACRDVDETRELGLPLYGRCAVPVTARGRIIETAWNVPVQIDGVEVQPGDAVIADGSGVAFIPSARAEEVLWISEQIVDRERQMGEAVRAGRSVAEVMGATYESMLSGG
jgi:4-hydroxy-4-methyl-2-oxoglutarate aldolase